MYKLYKVGDRMEPCGTPACMYLCVDILPSTETLNFRCERNEPIILAVPPYITIFFFFVNPLLFASCTNTFSKWCKITRGMKRSAQ
jgi:hypothetical protein